MRMRATQNLAVQHPREGIIGAVFGAPDDFIDPIMPYRTSPDNPETLVGCLIGIGHDQPPSERASQHSRNVLIARVLQSNGTLSEVIRHVRGRYSRKPP